jgi:hypothetical protein
MDELLTGNVWKQIAGEAKKHSQRSAAIAYVSDAKYLRLKKNDVLVCDASDAVIRSGGTSAKALKTYLDAGVRLYNYPNLHAKILVFGPNAVVGSCNVSASSANRLREAALLTSRHTVRSQAAALIHMSMKAADDINADFVNRIKKIKVVKRGLFVGKRRGPNEKLGNRTWVIRTTELDDDAFPEERKSEQQGEKEAKALLSQSDSEVNWVRWTGKSHFRATAKEGDTIMELNSPRRSKRVAVSGPVAILKRQDRGIWTRFYYEEPDDLPSLSWSEFERLLRKVGIQSIKKGSTRELSPYEASLMESIWGKM